MKDYEKLKECDRRARELAGLYAAEKERADSLETELRSFAKIREHYEHAKAKHPYFCDYLLPAFPAFLGTETMRSLIGEELSKIRRGIKLDIEKGEVEWDQLLNCEVWEINEAVVNNNTAAAIEECYDAIAVLLRVVDVLEGRQELGDPTKKEGAK
jgi:hypothetical protein